MQTARYLAEHGFGVRLEAPEDLEAFLEGLTPEGYATLRAELASQPRDAFTADESACRRLVERLKKPGEPLGSYGQASESTSRKIAA